MREGGLVQQGAEILVFIHETVHSMREGGSGRGRCYTNPVSLAGSSLTEAAIRQVSGAIIERRAQ